MLLFSIAAVSTVNSQIAISNYSEIDKIKKGITYIAMKDPGAPSVKEYIDVFKNNWTLSKIEFIKYADLEKHLSPDNSYLTIGGYETNVQFTELYKNGSRRNGINFSNTHLYLELWTVKKSFFERKNKNRSMENSEKTQVARIELFTDFETLSDPDKIFQSDYHGDGHIRNWGPGFLKNYIQLLTKYADKNQNRSLFAGMTNMDQLKTLKDEVLYVPDYVLTKFNKLSGDESKKHEEKKLFEDYSLKYSLISTAELNKKILSEQKPFYYLVYVKSSTDKFVSVVNSLTGEVIYSKYSPLSYNINSGDLKNIQKKI